MSSDASFYLNLLQFLPCLIRKDHYALYHANKFYIGSVPGIDYPRTIIGIHNATGFLNDVYSSGKLINDDLFFELKINPLLKKLNVDLDYFQNMPIPTMSLSAVKEGDLVKPGKFYLAFNTSYSFMSLVAMSMDRICEYQSYHFEEPNKKIREITKKIGSAPQILNEDSTRFYSATLAAYLARAWHLAGMMRFLDPRFEKAMYTEEKLKPDWNVNSSELINTIKSGDNWHDFENMVGVENAKKLIDDGIFLMHEKEWLNYNLQGYALDGGWHNTFSPDGSVENILGREIHNQENVFVIDSSYQSSFTNHILNSSGWYGKRGKRLDGPLAQFNRCPKLRAHRNVIPKIEVNDYDELISVLDIVREHCQGKNLFFRGQAEHHNLNRSNLTKRLLYGDQSVEELSLPTAASRAREFNADSFQARFQLQLQGMIYSDFEPECFTELIDNWTFWGHRSPFKNPSLQEKHEKFRRLYYSYEWDLLSMAIAQHYGIPTHGLDITDDLMVADWFALNSWYRYSENGEEYCWYKSRGGIFSFDLNNYPVIYIVATNLNLKRDLDQNEYIGLNALRPIRQKAFLHYGGWGLHSNICAQDVVAAIFLNANYSKQNNLSAEYLFPSPSEDKVYNQLLTLKEKAKEFNLNHGYKYIWHYKSPTRT